jgi:hypothetical protein
MDSTIDNYKNLLFAILNTEQQETANFICVYDTTDNDRLIAIFNSSRTCANFFKTSARSIDSTICRKNLKFNRYRLERVRNEGIYNREINRTIN